MASHDKATHVDHTKSMILKPLLSGAFTFIFNKYLLNEQDKMAFDFKKNFQSQKNQRVLKNEFRSK